MRSSAGVPRRRSEEAPKTGMALASECQHPAPSSTVRVLRPPLSPLMALKKYHSSSPLLLATAGTKPLVKPRGSAEWPNVAAA
ncbi:hypothetical protein E2562_025591 [Oryza meyeriana var. granulata]|uniref:Uncharacterized protein n=1 Tax=Oryza meyeriana var. granulata TaxID=110450 RepID=A0A6G1E1S9_9ORYZ|nr:hypothetical protein E2562_025591 [Oryza meyeriana var. granulata]